MTWLNALFALVTIALLAFAAVSFGQHFGKAADLAVEVSQAGQPEIEEVFDVWDSHL